MSSDAYLDLDALFAQATGIDNPEDRLAWFQLGVLEFNSRTNSGVLTLDDDGDMNRDLDVHEARILFLCALKAKVQKDYYDAALNSVLHRNDAGSTDLTNIPKALQERLKTIDAEIQAELDVTDSESVIAEVSTFELGETLPGRPAPQWPQSWHSWPWRWW
jgi:hypothetical protein